MAYHKKYYSVLLASVSLWCLLIVSPAILHDQSPLEHGIVHNVYSMFSLICHQYDSHSLHINGGKLGVCSRCSAIYFGFLIGIVLWPFLRYFSFMKLRVWWMIAVLPMLADVGCDLAAIHASDSSTRIITGSVFGILAAVLLTPIILDACSALSNQRAFSEGTTV